jgi:hypothetical protein
MNCRQNVKKAKQQRLQERAEVRCLLQSSLLKLATSLVAAAAVVAAA